MFFIVHVVLLKIVDDVENGIFSRYLKCSCDENNVFVHDGAEGDGVEPEHVDVAVGRQLGQQIDHVLQPGVALPDKERMGSLFLGVLFT